MANFETGFYSNMQGPDLGKIGEGFERGMRIGDMMRERKAKDLEAQKQNTIKEAFNNSYDVNPDGSRVLNPMKLQDLIGKAGYGQDAYKIGNELRTQQATSLENDGKIRSYVIDNTYGDIEKAQSMPGTPEAAALWEKAYDFGKNSGMNMAGYSRIYDPKQTDSIFASMLPYKDRVANRLKEKEAAARLAETQQRNSIDYAKIDIDKKRLENEVAKESAKSLPSYKVANLNSGDKARLDNIKLGYPAAAAMDKALNDGDNTFTLAGDNKFTIALDQMSEAFGRMQSGGAINKDEEDRFKKMSPKATDTKEIQATKLANMQKVFLDRLDTLGLKPEDVGIKVAPLTYGKPKIQTGQEEDGYIFIGGDPADSKSWRKK